VLRKGKWGLLRDWESFAWIYQRKSGDSRLRMWSHLWLLLLRLIWGREFGPWFVNILAAHRRGRGIYWLGGRVWPVEARGSIFSLL